MVNFGEFANRIAVIVEIIDHNRVIIDGPTSNVPRQVISIRRIELTKMNVSLPRAARTGTVKKVMEKEEVAKKFAASEAGQKIAKKAARANLCDFGRHKLMVAQKKV